MTPRTAAPVCGTIMQDVIGTAQGDWCNPAQPTSPEDPHLALVYDNVFPSSAVFSVGTSAAASGLGARAYVVFPKASADATRINYDFKLVTNDGNIYCYENFYDFPDSPSLQSGMTGRIILIELTSATTLRIERQGNGVSSTCANSGAWSFTSNASNFQR